MKEGDTDLPFVPIWCAQIQISSEIGVGESDMSVLLFNKTACSSLWQAGKNGINLEGMGRQGQANWAHYWDDKDLSVQQSWR